MKKTLTSLVAGAAFGASCLFGNSAFADGLKVGDKMPEPRGRYVLVAMGEYLNSKDSIAIDNYVKGNISTKTFNFVLKPHRKPENSGPNPLDFELSVIIPGTNKIYKRIVLISDEKRKDIYSLFQDCAPDGFTDLKRKIYFDYNSVQKLNAEEISCNIITLTDFPSRKESDYGSGEIAAEFAKNGKK